jgi:sugar phosphate permease
MIPDVPLSRDRSGARGRGRPFYGWNVLAAGSVIMGIASGVSGYAATIFFLPISQALGLSHAATSLATSVARLENSFLAFFVGWAIDRFGPRPAIAVGMTLTGSGLILFGLFANSLLTLIITWSFMVALGTSIGGFPPVWAALNNWFVRKKGRAMGVGMAAQSLGGLLIAPVLAVLIAMWGWRTAAVISGVFVLVVTLPISRVMHARPSDLGLYPDGDPPPHERAEAAAGRPVQRPVDNFSLRQAVRAPALWTLGLSFGIRQLVAGGVTLHLSPMLQDEGLSSVRAGAMVGLLAFMGVVGALIIGVLADRFERRRVAGVVVLVESAALFALYFGGVGWTLYVFLAGYGFAIGVHTLNRVLLGDYFGQTHYARLWGLLSVCTTPLAITGPVLAGWVFDTTQSYRQVILVFAVLLLVAAVGYFNCRRPATPLALREA